MTSDSYNSENLHVEIFDLEKENLETSIEPPDFLQEKYFTPLDPNLDQIFSDTLTENELEEKFNIQPAPENEVSLLPRPEFLEKEEISELDAFAQWHNNHISHTPSFLENEEVTELDGLIQCNNNEHFSLNSHENVLKESEDMLNEISDFSAQNDELDNMLNQFDIEVNQLEQNLEELKGTLASFNQGLKLPISSSNNDLDQIFADFDKEVHQVFQDIPLEEISISYKNNELATDDNFAQQIENIISPDINDDDNFSTPITPDISDYTINTSTLTPQDEIDHLTNFIPQELEENKISLNLSEFNNIAIEEEEEEEILEYEKEDSKPTTIEIDDIHPTEIMIPQEKSISEDTLTFLNTSIPMSSSPFTTLSKEEFTQVLRELDTLLEFLPDSKIEELIHKDFYHLYIRLMDELGI